MIDYKAVPSGLEISQRIADCLEAAAPRGYQFDQRACAVRGLNDILQGRSTRSADELLAELDKCEDARIPAILEDVRAFLRQKELLTMHYSGSSCKQFCCKRRMENGKAIKVIGQRIYNRAAKAGFPPDFFRESYFDNVTFYCLPQQADFYGSVLRNCRLAVCRMDFNSFIGAQVYDTEFYSCVMNSTDFFAATIAHTRFNDCELSHTMLHKARMIHCRMIDCTMDHANFMGTLLDSCIFSRITAGNIRNLDKATISLGGATLNECCQNEKAIYAALGMKGDAA